MDTYRFYVPDLLAQIAPEKGGDAGPDAWVRLPEDQERHARQVLRLEAGQAVELFDGKGAWARGTVGGGGGGKQRALSVRAQGPQQDPPPPMHLTLATAVPKGDRAEWLVEQASQLNVGAIQWLACDRGVVKPREGGQKMEKWRRLAVESAKQCGRNVLMDIAEPVALEEVLQQFAGGAGEGAKGGARGETGPADTGMMLWLEPRAGGLSVFEAMGRGGGASRKHILALVGPEGGWSPREWALLEAAVQAGRAQRVRLTSTILRIETACAAMAAVVMSTH